MGLILAAVAAVALLALAGRRKAPVPGLEAAPPPGGGGGGVPKPKPTTPPSATKSYTLQAGDTPNSVANRFGTTPGRLAELNPGLNWKAFTIAVRETFAGRRNDSVDETLHPVIFTLTQRVNTEEWPVYHTTAGGGGYYYFPAGYDAPGVATDTRFGRVYSDGGTWNKYVLGWKAGIAITVPSTPDA